MSMKLAIAAAALLTLTSCGGGSDAVDEALSTTKPPTPISEIEKSVAADLQAMSDGPQQVSVDCPAPTARRYSIVCGVDGGEGVVSAVNGIYHGVDSVRVTSNKYGGFSWDFAD